MKKMLRNFNNNMMNVVEENVKSNARKQARQQGLEGVAAAGAKKEQLSQHFKMLDMMFPG